MWVTVFGDKSDIVVTEVIYELELRLKLSGKYIEDSLLFALLHAFSKVKVDLSFYPEPRKSYSIPVILKL